MRILIAFPFAVWAVAACAAPPSATDSYLAARKAAKAELEKTARRGGGEDKLAEQDRRLRAALEKQLRRLVAVKVPKGFGGASSMSPETLLAGSIESGGPDGLLFESSGGRGRILASTLGLLRPWLEERSADKDGTGIPAEPDAALRSDAFYTLAVSPDASVNRFARLAVKAPTGVSAVVAQLVLVTQESTAYPPADLTVAVIKSDSVFVALVPARAKPQPIAACQALLEAARRKSEAALQRYNASGQSDTKSFDLSTRLESEGAEAFRQCWIREAPRQPGFAALQAQAQQLADAFAAEAPLGD